MTWATSFKFSFYTLNLQFPAWSGSHFALRGGGRGLWYNLMFRLFSSYSSLDSLYTVLLLKGSADKLKHNLPHWSNLGASLCLSLFDLKLVEISLSWYLLWELGPFIFLQYHFSRVLGREGYKQISVCLTRSCTNYACLSGHGSSLKETSYLLKFSLEKDEAWDLDRPQF